jgi:hypothetical protein
MGQTEIGSQILRLKRWAHLARQRGDLEKAANYEQTARMLAGDVGLDRRPAARAPLPANDAAILAELKERAGALSEDLTVPLGRRGRS